MEKLRITFNGKSYEVEVERLTGTTGAAPKPCAAPVAAAASPAPAPKAAAPAPAPAAAKAAAPAAAGGQQVCAPMPGKILSVNVKAGDTAKRGDVLLVLEAMKMQNEIMAPADGKVADVRVSAGQTVSTGDVMVVLA
jgi:biotin carboxyl carrier protein